MIAPVVKSILVRCTPEHAFRVFTAELATWWPLATHSLAAGAAAEAVSCAIEPYLGGRWYETWSTGEEHALGRIVEWDPPHRIAVDWNPSFEDRPYTRLELRFTAEPDGTRVELEHAGWELLGARGEAHRASYQTGWDMVLAAYLARLPG